MPERSRLRAARIGSLALLGLTLYACGETKKVSETVATPVLPVARASQIGRVDSVEVTATGDGATRDDAIRDAVIRAVEQVHGRAIAVSTVSQELGSLKFGSSEGDGATTKTSSAVITATIGGRTLDESTRGFVTSIVVTGESHTSSAWHVTVKAAVARYSPPGNGKTKVVVALLPSSGGAALDKPAEEQLREAVVEGLTSTARAVVLERDQQSSAAFDAELAIASSGAARPTEQLKQSQMDVADIVVTLRVDQFDVHRNANKMRTTNREVVSYDENATLTYRVVELATRQVIASGTAHASHSTEPSLQEPDTSGWWAAMLKELALDATNRIVSSLFPIRVVSQSERDVTLNAGTGRVKEGDQLDIVILGADIKDPESGAILGRVEKPCCTVTIDRVIEHLAFGHLDSAPSLQPSEVLEARRR